VGETTADRNSDAAGGASACAVSGPAVRWRPQASWGERILQMGVAAVLAAALGLGLVLKPSPTGTGTHTVLGLPPCGMLVMTGHPCPTCGVTTSYVLAAHGQFYDSLVNQPFGLIVFLAVAAGLVATLATLVTGRSWALLARASVVATAAIVMVALVLASWAYKWATL